MGQGLLVRRGGQGGQSSYVFGSLSISENGTYLPSSYSLDAFSRVDVNVLPSYTSMAISITENGLYKPQDYNVDAFAEVNVNVGDVDMLASYINNELISLYNSNIYYLGSMAFRYNTKLQYLELPNLITNDPYTTTLPGTAQVSFPNIMLITSNAMQLGPSATINDKALIHGYSNQGSHLWGSYARTYGYSMNGKLALTYVIGAGNNNSSWISYIPSSQFDSITGVLNLGPSFQYIGDNAFASASISNTLGSLVKKFMAEEVTAIGSSAFYSLSQCTEYYLPKCIAIGDYAFATRNQSSFSMTLGDLEIVWAYGCFGASNIGRSYLSKLSIVGSNAFAYFHGDLSVDLTNITVLGSLAFCSASHISFSGYIDSIYVSSLNYYSFLVPSYSVQKVKYITAQAFESTTIDYIPMHDVTEIHTAAFRNTLVTSISEDACNAVGAYAFTSCSKLSQVYLSIATIITNAFTSCSVLNTIIAPMARYINSAFLSCYNLTSLTLDWENLSFSSMTFKDLSLMYNVDESGVTWLSIQSNSKIILISTNSPNLISASECLYFDGGMNGVNVGANIYRLPNLKYLPYSKLSSNRNVTQLYLDNCSFIDAYACFSASRLTTLYAPNVKSVNYAAFSNCSRLQTVDITSCTYIGNNAFNTCRSLSVISIPYVSYIGSNAFAGCISFSMTITSALTTIGSGAFNQVYWGSTNRNLDFTSAWISWVGSGHFFYGNALTMSVSIVSNAIPTTFMGWCQSLTAFTANFSTDKSYVSIGPSAFSLNYVLSEINLYINGVPTSNICYIGGDAFNSCVSSFIKFSAYLTSASEWTQYEISKTLQIGRAAFAKCSVLSKVFFTLSVYESDTTSRVMYGSVGGSCFADAIKLQSLYLYLDSAHTPYIPAGGYVPFKLENANAFTNSPMSNSALLGDYGSIYVNASLLSAYQSATNWTYLSERLVGLTDEEFAQVLANW